MASDSKSKAEKHTWMNASFIYNLEKLLFVIVITYTCMQAYGSYLLV